MLKNLNKISIFLVLFLLPAYIFRFQLGPLPLTILELLIYVVFAIFLISKKIRWHKSFWYPTVFVIFALISALVDPDLIGGLGLWKAYFFDGLLIYFMVCSLDKDDREQALWWIVGGGGLTSFVAIIMFLKGIKTTDGRIYDLDMISPNYLALYLSPIFLGTLFLTAKESLRLWLKWIIAILILSALVLTQSRGAILSIGCGFIFVLGFYLSKKFKLKTSPLIISLLGLVIFLGGAFVAFKPDWTDHGRKASSSNIRYYIWETSVEIISKNPFLGVGLSNYQNYFSNLTSKRVNFPEYISPQALTAHNLYLQLLTVGGIGLFISFLAFLMKTYFWKTDNIVFLVMLVAILSYGLVDTPIFRNDLAGLFFAVAGLATFLPRDKK